MFAVIKTGGKQYRVEPGDVVKVERLAADAGETVQFNEVLMLGGDAPVIGTPRVDGAGVQAEVLEQGRGEKLIHYVKRRRKHSSQRTRGHRQHLTVLRVTEILASGAQDSGVKAATGGAGTAAPAAKAPAAAKPAAKPAGTAKGEKPAPAPEAAEAGRKPANLLDAPRDGQADDLKKITGLGPKMESALNAEGVFHFDQIAAWSDAELAYMDEALSLRGRAARDGWVAQAAALAEDKE